MVLNVSNMGISAVRNEKIEIVNGVSKVVNKEREVRVVNEVEQG